MFSKDNVAVKSLSNSLKNNKLSHAYLFSYENREYGDSFILKFVKSIFCLNNESDEFYSCETCKNCTSINHNNYVDFLQIDSEGMTIKKDDVLFLKSELSVKAFYGKRVYWIKNIENMTQQAANSILKFLEEPEDNIIAILSCQNIGAVLPTIISRCQQIKLLGSNTTEIDNSHFENIVGEIARRFSKNKHLAILYAFEKVANKEDVSYFFDFLVYKIKDSYKKYSDNVNELSNISNIQEKVLTATRELKMNVASALVLEKFFFSIILDNNDISFLGNEA